MSRITIIASRIRHHYREGNIRWHMVVRMILLHAMAIVGLTRLDRCSHETILWSFFLYVASMLGITAGAHRLWAHRSYHASLPARTLLMLFNSIANQGPIYHWARDHRVHHRHSETVADPHDVTRGAFHAHVGWLLLKKNQRTIRAGREIDLTDLMEDGVVVFQKRCEPYLTLGMCFVMPTVVAVMGWGEGVINALLVGGVLRYCLVLHGTFLVNSAAHIYGDRPYDVTSHASENPMVAGLTLGEGWHNWHHRYPFDYAASEYGFGCQFNPTKSFIDLLALVGWVGKRKRATKLWEKAKMRRGGGEVGRKRLLSR